jgi:hypothetical protein
MWRATLTAMLLFGSALPALAARIDINDPALLGPVLFSINVHQGFNYEALITQVRHEDGVYSYIYAVQTTPYFPGAWGLAEGEPELLSVAVTGRPLSGTWGAIYSSSSIWGGFASPTNVVESITPIDDGFIAIPQGNGAGSFTVVYWQSPRPPAFDGTLTYTAHNYCFSYPRCFNEDGSRRYEVGSFDENVFAPVPEPGSIFLLGAGLTAWALQRRGRNATSV